MAELLFIATTVFVAYVLFTVIGGEKTKPDTTSQPAVEPVSSKEPAPAAEKPTPPPASPKPVKKTTKASAAKPKATTSAKKAQPAAAPAPTAISSDSLKNPKTGEVAKLPSNYAFAKRWVKEALVEEGLLDKIYKNNELDSDTNAKITSALQQLKSLEKYQ